VGGTSGEEGYGEKASNQETPVKKAGTEEGRVFGGCDSDFRMPSAAGKAKVVGGVAARRGRSGSFIRGG
jgi:hypothetical protein